VTYEPPVHVYDSSSDEYRQAFREFLAHTDQKVRARQWLERMVGSLSSRRTFIDAGAGTGTVTAWLADRFERTLALEPNASLCQELRQACPEAEVRQEAIMDVTPVERADLVLCSHVLYYIQPQAWQAHLAAMASWLSPRGELVIVLQSSDTDCMDMLAHFHRQRFDLRLAGEEFEKEHAGRYRTELENVPAAVTTADLASTMAIAEFMLNLLPMPDPPTRTALEEYVVDRFAHDGAYRFSCDQDFLRITPVAFGA
jgi:trans-aconitate methyltransferase